MAYRLKQKAFLFGFVLVLAGCTTGITEPLSPSELDAAARSVEKPAEFVKLSEVPLSEFEESYGDQGRTEPTFENSSDECSAVADLDRVSRFAPGGNDFRKFMPADLRDFEDVAGLGWSLVLDEENIYSYAQVDIALLSFSDEEVALEFSNLISENIKGCFDFKEETEGFLMARQLSSVVFSDEKSPDFLFEYTSYIELSAGTIEIDTASDWAIAIMHFGPNLAIVTAQSDDDSRSEIGVSTSDLVDGFDALRASIESAITEAQKGPANS